MKWLDKIPWTPLLLIALMLGLAPFQPEPHLWQKLKMLAAGTLARPIDIFDLFLHGTPALLVLLKLGRMATGGNGRGSRHSHSHDHHDSHNDAFGDSGGDSGGDGGGD